MPIRWPWESDKAYARRLKAWEVKQGEITERVQARQQGRSDRTQSKSEGGYYSPEAVAARQATVQYGIDAGLTAAEGVAMAFGYPVDIDGSASGGSRSSSGGAPVVASAPSSSSFGGMDQQTMLLLAALALGGVFLLSRR
jgi:hypothetical protein